MDRTWLRRETGLVKCSLDKVAVQPVHCVKEQLKQADEETNKRTHENRQKAESGKEKRSKTKHRKTSRVLVTPRGAIKFAPTRFETSTLSIGCY